MRGESGNDQKLDEKRERLKKQKPQEGAQETGEPSLLFNYKEQMKRFFSLTPLEPEESDEPFYDKPTPELNLINPLNEDIVNKSISHIRNSSISNFMTSLGLSEEQIENSYYKFSIDVKGLYISILQEPQLTRKRIYLIL